MFGTNCNKSERKRKILWIFRCPVPYTRESILHSGVCFRSTQKKLLSSAIIIKYYGRTPARYLLNEKTNCPMVLKVGMRRKEGRKEGNVLCNDALNTFYLWLYGVRHNIMVKDHSDSERENPLPPHGLLFPISSKGSFICIFPQKG